MHSDTFATIVRKYHCLKMPTLLKGSLIYSPKLNNKKNLKFRFDLASIFKFFSEYFFQKKNWIRKKKSLVFL